MSKAGRAETVAGVECAGDVRRRTGEGVRIPGDGAGGACAYHCAASFR